jgi:hypothetical protein
VLGFCILGLHQVVERFRLAERAGILSQYATVDACARTAAIL